MAGQTQPPGEGAKQLKLQFNKLTLGKAKSKYTIPTLLVTRQDSRLISKIRGGPVRKFSRKAGSTGEIDRGVSDKQRAVEECYRQSAHDQPIRGQ